ncbi:hypothetical protein P3G55_10425 [Leptospira sp. 96542]|nr:hypothetical protein [Leptospira sp. 96542]
MKFLFIFLIFIFSIFGEETENITESEIYVGDIIHYTLTKAETIEFETTEGEVYFDETSPSLRIYDITEINNTISLKIIFFKPGNYTLPISWTKNGKPKNSKLNIIVKSQLAETDSEIEDVESPIVFSGPYLLRLISLILFIILNLYFLYAIFLYIKRKQRVVDAIWQPQQSIPPNIIKKKKIETILQGESIPQKEFIYLISEFLKEELGDRFNIKTKSLTDSEFLSAIYDRSHIDNDILRELRLLFRTSKYEKKDNLLTNEEANEIWRSIQENLKV